MSESLQAIQDRLGRPIMFVMQLRVFSPHDVRGQAVEAISGAGAVVGDVELDHIEKPSGDLIYNVEIYTTGDEQMAAARAAANDVEGVAVVEVIDIALEAHRDGSCQMASAPIESNSDLRIVYTPGVARVCKAIEANPDLASEYTAISNTVAIVTNGTAILGLGDIGCVAGMPVMEGKSAIFRNFADISAIPILVDTKDPDAFIETVCNIAPTFGAIQVEDVKAPECFRITRELDKRLPIPVMHDDQHGTATIVLASLYSAVNVVGRKMEDLKVAISGAGASATAISELLQIAGVADVVLVDSRGIVSRDRTDLNEEKQALAERTNKENVSGTLADAMKGTDLFVGCSMPNIVSQDMVRSMAKDPIVFALANPVSEIGRDDALAAGAAVYADGRQVNNAIAYPGIFRGALDARCTKITLKMMMAAAKRLSELVEDGELLPEMMNPETHLAVAEAVMENTEG